MDIKELRSDASTAYTSSSMHENLSHAQRITISHNVSNRNGTQIVNLVSTKYFNILNHEKMLLVS